MSRGLTMTRGHRTGAIMMSHCGTRMEGTHSDVTWTHGDTRMEGTDNSDVTWTRRDTRTCHSITRGRRGHIVMSHGWRGQIQVMSPGLTVTRGWRGQNEVMSPGLSVT